MTAIDTTAGQGIGVSISGSPKKGQHVKIIGETALLEVFGTENPEMANALLSHCLRVLRSDEATDDKPANDERQFMLTAVAEIKPQDAIERMLAVQMAATHVALIRTAGRFARAEMLLQLEAHERGYNKLARTFAAQAETLRKHRNGGKQTVTVQHVNVEGGGQAIVGNVQTGGEGSNES